MRKTLSYEIIERLSTLETLMSNHLKHHETIIRWLLSPIIVGIVVLIVKEFGFK